MRQFFTRFSRRQPVFQPLRRTDTDKSPDNGHKNGNSKNHYDKKTRILKLHTPADTVPGKFQQAQKQRNNFKSRKNSQNRIYEIAAQIFRTSAPKRVRDRSFSDKTGKTQGMKLRIKPPKTAVSSKVSDKLPER